MQMRLRLRSSISKVKTSPRSQSLFQDTELQRKVKRQGGELESGSGDCRGRRALVLGQQQLRPARRWQHDTQLLFSESAVTLPEKKARGSERPRQVGRGAWTSVSCIWCPGALRT